MTRTYLNEANLARQLKLADQLDKLRACVTCGSSVARKGSDVLHPCVNHTKVRCCGAIHDGMCRIGAASVGNSTGMWHSGWLCPRCAPPAPPAKREARIADLKARRSLERGAL